VDDWSSARLCDVGNLFLGMILFFSPWLFGLSAGAQWQTASTVGIFIAVLSVAALAAFAIWEEWLNLIVGLWLIASPWLLGFQDSSAMAVDVSIGAVVAILAALEVWLTHDTRPSQAARRLRPCRRRPGDEAKPCCQVCAPKIVLIDRGRGVGRVLAIPLLV
jgi:hypothetical protein